MCNSVDIVGVPNVSSRNAREVSQKIFREALNIDIPDEQLIECYAKRIKSRPANNNTTPNLAVDNLPNDSTANSGRPANLTNDSTQNSNESGNGNNKNNNNRINNSNILCITFSTPYYKQLVMNSQKLKPENLSASIFDNKFSNNIYINDSLSAYYRALLREAKKIKSKKKICIPMGLTRSLIYEKVF